MQLDLDLNVQPISGQKQPSSDVLRKRYSENMQQIYRRSPMPKCDFSKVALQYPQENSWVGVSFRGVLLNRAPISTQLSATPSTIFETKYCT